MVLRAVATDPDGNGLSYRWFVYDEAGTFTNSSARTGQPVEIENADRADATLVVPTSRILHLGTMHVLVAVTDTGTPALTRYARVVVNVTP